MTDTDSYQLTGQSVRRIQRAVTRSETQPYDISGSSSANIASGTSIAWQRGTNAAGQTIPAYSCVAVGSISASPDGYLASLTQPLGSTGTQFGLTGGSDCASKGPNGTSKLLAYHLEAGWATYDSGMPNAGEMWGPKSGQFSLSKGGAGFIVANVVDASKKIMAVIRSTSPWGLGKLTATLSPGGSATCEIWNLGGDASVSISVADWLMKTGDTALAIGTKVIWGWLPGSSAFVVLDWQCQ